MSKERLHRTGKLFCSFCGKDESAVRLVAGPAVCICSGCVTDAQRVLAEMDTKAGIKPKLAKAQSKMAGDETGT
jgi:ATP-dependent protease Clp ATPase subunit